MDGRFRVWLQRAVRVDDDADWSTHTIDYAQFKQRLKWFARRRSKIRNMLRQSRDGKIAEQAVIELLQPHTFLPSSVSGAVSASSDPPQHQQQHQPQHFPRASSSSSLSRPTTISIPQQGDFIGDGLPGTVVDASDGDVGGSTKDITSPSEITTGDGGGRSGSLMMSTDPITGGGGPGVAGAATISATPYIPMAGIEMSSSNDEHDDDGRRGADDASTSSSSKSNAPNSDNKKDSNNRRSNLPRTASQKRRMMLQQQQQSQSQDKSNSRKRSAAGRHASGGTMAGTEAGGGPVKSGGVKERRTKRNVLRRLSNAERNELALFLTFEMDKVLMFYLSQWQKLSHQLESADANRKQPDRGRSGGGNCSDRWDAVAMAATLEGDGGVTAPSAALDPGPPADRHAPMDVELGEEILELIAFCVINIITAHQILIRYDAFARAFEGTPPMQAYYLKKVTKHPTSFRKILHHEELNAVADSYIRSSPGFPSPIDRGRTSSSTTLLMGASPRVAEGYDLHQEEAVQDPVVLRFVAQRQMFQEILSSSHRASSESSTLNLNAVNASPTSYDMSPYKIKDKFFYGMHNWFLLGLFEDRLGLEPAYLTNRGRSLTREMEQLAMWRKKKRSQESTASSQSHQRSPSPAMNVTAGTTAKPEEVKRLSDMQVYHITLNLLSAFLYCMNYYIVEPSSTMYVNRLGAHDALSGTLIGMLPLAAFISSIPYSMWTNRSFRQPFIMSSVMLIIGNVTYSVADQFQNVSIALIGRFISGLGAPKCIIRRYMADTTPMALRTGVNAGFGMVVAAGSAMGPAMAIVLSQMDYTFTIPYLEEENQFGILNTVTLNGLTLPGYFMACLWITFTVIVIMTFEEPDREGLKEQQQLELQGGIPGSPSMVSSGEATINKSSTKGDDSISYGAASSEVVSCGSFDPKSSNPPPLNTYNSRADDDLNTIFSGESHDYSSAPFNNNSVSRHHHLLCGDSAGIEVVDCFEQHAIEAAGNDGISTNAQQPLHAVDSGCFGERRRGILRIIGNARTFVEFITLPVRLCLSLLFAKVFTIEALVSATSALSKNRYHWQVQQVGTLGFLNGIMVIPFSILVGRLSMSYQDHVLMSWLVGIGCFGMFLLIDLSDLVAAPTRDYNMGHALAVSPVRYIAGYFISYISIQTFEGVIGSTLSKVIPTALASGTFNSGLLATLVDTFGRSCGDLFISFMGFISLRQLMNLLFIPGFTIMLTAFIMIHRYRDMLSV